MRRQEPKPRRASSIAGDASAAIEPEELRISRTRFDELDFRAQHTPSHRTREEIAELTGLALSLRREARDEALAVLAQLFSLIATLTHGRREEMERLEALRTKLGLD